MPEVTTLPMKGDISEDILVKTLHVLNGIVETQNGFSSEISEIKAFVHSIDKRMAVIETNTVEKEITQVVKRLDRHSERLKELETDKQQRDGAFKSMTWLGENWGWIVGMIALITIYVSNIPEKIAP